MGDCVREARDEFAIEITEAQEGSDSFDSFEWGPSRNGR